MYQVLVIEPETFGELEEYWQLFAQHLGPDRGRFVCEFPKKWTRMVYDSFRQREGIVELRKFLGSKAFVRRTSVAADGSTWLERVEKEHARDPFSLVVVVDVDESLTDKLPLVTPMGLGSVEAPLSLSVERTARALAAPAENLLRYSSRVRFVDPYFEPVANRWRNTLEQLLRWCATGDQDKDILEFHTMVAQDTRVREDTVSWKDSCNYLTEILPDGIELTVVRWDVLPDGPKMHDRMILTERGGLQYGYGFDTSAKGETLVSRLDQATAMREFELLAPAATRYKLVDRVTVG